MAEENISQEFRPENIDKARNYFAKEVEENQLMSKKHKNGFMALNYIEHFLVLAFVITGCTFMSDSTSLVGIPISFMNSTIGLKICAITAGIKNYKPIIKRRRRKNMIK